MGQDRGQRVSRIERRAAEWAVRRADPAFREADRRALQRWLDRDPAHAVAFAAALESWTELGDLRPAPGLWPRPAPAPARRLAVWPARVALAASLLLAVLAGLRYGGDLLLALEADYRSGRTEQLALTLPDGSQVELNGNSAIALDFDERQRRMRLLRGEALFHAAPLGEGESRPFVVEAADGTSRALGTVFAVRRDDSAGEAVVVSMLEHAVEVTAASGDSLVLSERERVRYDAGGLGAVAALDADALAWREGLLVFDRVPLSQAVAELNRYRREPLLLGDEALGRLLVSGVFRLDDLDAAVQTIAGALRVEVVTIPLVMTLLY